MSIASGKIDATRTSKPRRPADRLRRIWTSSLNRSPRFVGNLTLVFGLLTLLHALLGGHRRVQMITQFAPVTASDTATAVTAAAGLLLLKLSGGLRRGQRRAWRVAVVVVLVVIVAHVVRGIDIPALVVSTLLLASLLASRRRFKAKADITSRWLALRVFVQLFLVAVLYGLALLYVRAGHRLGGDAPFLRRLQEVLGGLIGLDGPLQLRGDEFPTIFFASMLSFGILIAFTTAYLLLRPTEPRAVLSVDDEQRLRQLLARNGRRDSLGYFALRRDKSVVWSPSGKAAITYRVVSGVALVSGDPIGDPEAWPGAIGAYCALVEEYAWIPAVIGCSETGATIFQREAGLSALQLGDEAIIDVDEFSLGGRPMRGVRQACTRVLRAGYSVDVRRVRDVPAEQVGQLVARADHWRGNEVERGYSMALSRLGDPDDGDCVIATATVDGEVRGILHFVPWGPDGLSLDLMRRDRGADNGLNELMIVKVIEAGNAIGVARVSLNFAVFREALERGDRIGAGPVLRAWRGVLVFLSRWFQIESLYRFNLKFRPAWEPRFLSFPSSRALPRIGIAALEAEAFITRPKLVNRLLGRR